MRVFPRYSREENLSCKLTDTDIKEVLSMRKQGLSYQKIADKYGMSLQGIRYWCLSEEQRKETNKKKKRNPRAFDYVAYRERKKSLHPELSEYELSVRKTFTKVNPERDKETQRRSWKNYRVKYKEILKKKNKKYQLANLDKFRAYNKKHREKITTN